jgi:Flp pilus assembly protein TadD
MTPMAEVDAHLQRGRTLRRQGDLSGAVAALTQAVQLAPEAGEGHTELGLALARLGRVAEALPHFEKAADVLPNLASVHHNLGTALLDLNRPAEAIPHLQKAVALDARSAGAHHNLGKAHRLAGQVPHAIDFLREAVRLDPQSADIRTSLAEALAADHRLEEAVVQFREAATLAPDKPGVLRNLGMALMQQDDLAGALEVLERAVQVEPSSAEAWCSLGYVRGHRERFSEALTALDRALEIDPQHVSAHMNRALLRLLLGQFGTGLTEYEWRWKTGNLSLPPFQKPNWDGTPLTGRTILLHSEQGSGDTIQFIRYAPLLKQRGATVLLACPAKLVRLLSTCPGIDRVVAKGEPIPRFDVHAPLVSLPRLLDTTTETIPSRAPYLSAEPALVERWRQELRDESGFKVGIAWQGSRTHKEDRWRSVPLAQFALLAQVPGVRLYSLQKGDGAEQIAQADFPLVDLGSRLDEETGAFVDTAAVMRNLDLVIAVDTALIHLAGALGVTAWLPLTHTPDWRWQVGREDCPWYPSLRLFRQKELSRWGPVFERMAKALAEQAGKKEVAKPVRVEVAPGELIDKITILQIKTERIKDEAKLRNVRIELETLAVAQAESLREPAELTRLTADLKKVNEALWEIEDEIRICEKEDAFGPRFVELARSVYHQNDRRAALKRQINELLGSRLIEEKAYVQYGKGDAPATDQSPSSRKSTGSKKRK